MTCRDKIVVFSLIFFRLFNGVVDKRLCDIDSRTARCSKGRKSANFEIAEMDSQRLYTL